MRWAVILAGGSGTRFWPLSTPDHPKQLLPLTGPRSTAEAAVDRLEGLVPRERVLLVTGSALAPRLQERLRLDPANVLIEPRAASTGPALVWATWEAAQRDPDAEVLSLHADWAVGDEPAFRRTAAAALTAAREQDRLITVGMVPSRPETGFGYIVPGSELAAGVWTVARFVEKPDAAAALDLMADGALWNSGLFAWTAARLLGEIARRTPEIAPHLAALRRRDAAAFFHGVTPVSIDVGLLERSDAVAVVRGAFAWDDVGTWEALARVRPRDASGNVLVGEAVAHDARDNVVWAERDTVVLNGVKDLIVVQARGRVLVMPRERAADMKRLLDALPPSVRDVPG
ncbi:MAG TPA: sugar phosphate nucleotidyltransferase [Gemmatimonadales bacterium]|nr:sugar phosphate nucleotidyltransferase [Gemmatimonadales bacterium]